MTDNMNKNRDLIQLENEKLTAENTIALQSKFLMGLGHELRTPLNVILGFAQLLKQVNSTNLTDDQRSSVEEIIQSANHLVEISEETLAWSKVDMNRHSPILSAVRLSEVISRIWQLLYSECQLKNIRFTIKVNQLFININNLSDISILVIADALILQQGMLNIITILVKNMPNHGVITINIDTDSEKHQLKNSAKITIHSGQAVYNLAEKSTLSSTTELPVSTDVNHVKKEEVNVRLIVLGLTKTKHLIKSINGKFKVDRNKKGHELFSIELACPDIALANNHSLYTDSNPKEPDVSILYIEDNPATVRLVKQLLKNIGEFSFYSADSAQKGLEIATKIQPKLILIDINLPDYGGIELVNSLKKMATIESTKLIAISGEVAPEYIKEALNQGFDDYITKPICLKEFSNKISVFFNK